MKATAKNHYKLVKMKKISVFLGFGKRLIAVELTSQKIKNMHVGLCRCTDFTYLPACKWLPPFAADV